MAFLQFPHTFQFPREPLVLTVPGLNNSGPGHWQTRWEQRRDDCRRVDLGDWSKPWRNDWVHKLDLAIQHAANHAGRPVVLAAHSLGCLAVAWWAAHAHRDDAALVRGALLVAPPEVDFFPLDERLETFAPTPSQRLPFPSILVASQDDPWMGIHAARRLARTWGSQFADAGRAGHINADSALGDWHYGQFLIERLIHRLPADADSPEIRPAREGLLSHQSAA